MSGILYIVATPIGNLTEITDRARQVLTDVDFVLAEDTRVTVRLFNHLEIKKRMFTYTEHSPPAQVKKIIEELEAGKTFALVSDAGTPGISDPGSRLINDVLKADIQVIPISGPSAVSTLVSVFGRPHLAYHFWGFFPIKRKKQVQIIECIESVPGIHVFFDSPFRILKTLEKYFIDKTGYHMVIGREMTKLHETYYRGTCKEVYDALSKDVVKGEFCVGLISEDL